MQYCFSPSNSLRKEPLTTTYIIFKRIFFALFVKWHCTSHLIYITIYTSNFLYIYYNNFGIINIVGIISFFLILSISLLLSIFLILSISLILSSGSRLAKLIIKGEVCLPLINKKYIDILFVCLSYYTSWATNMNYLMHK